MIRTLRFVALLMVLSSVAQAQDVQGVELCTHEIRMDRRTGCLQSNIEYLQGVITKNAAEARQKLTAAANEITALKGDVTALKAALAALQARVEKLEAAAKPAAKSTDKSNDKPPEKSTSPAAK